jgi:hypothetical protein
MDRSDAPVRKRLPSDTTKGDDIDITLIKMYWRIRLKSKRCKSSSQIIGRSTWKSQLNPL